MVASLIVVIGTRLPLAPRSISRGHMLSASPFQAKDLEGIGTSDNGVYGLQARSYTGLSHTLEPRASDSKAYTNAEVKGTAFRCYFDGTKPFPPTSWKSYEGLESWGWQRSTRNAVDTNHLLRPIADTLQAKGIDTVAGRNQYVRWDQRLTTQHGSKHYLPTQGTYGNIYNPAQGLIIAHKNFGPAYEANKARIPASNIPDLQQWSDVTFLEFSRMASSDQLKKLRYVMRYQVQGDTTPDIVRRALEKCNKKPKVPVWPGFTFEPDAVRRGVLGGNKCKGAYEAARST